MPSKRPTDKPTASERTAMVTRLRGYWGIPATWTNEIVRSGVPRHEIVERLIERLRGER